jgi:hypothetical protein
LCRRYNDETYKSFFMDLASNTVFSIGGGQPAGKLYAIAINLLAISSL